MTTPPFPLTSARSKDNFLEALGLKAYADTLQTLVGGPPPLVQQYSHGRGIYGSFNPFIGAISIDTTQLNWLDQRRQTLAHEFFHQGQYENFRIPREAFRTVAKISPEISDYQVDEVFSDTFAMATRFLQETAQQDPNKSKVMSNFYGARYFGGSPERWVDAVDHEERYHYPGLRYAILTLLKSRVYGGHPLKESIRRGVVEKAKENANGRPS